MEPVTVATDPKVTDEKIADNMDTLLLLWDEKWEKLQSAWRKTHSPGLGTGK